MKNVKHLSGICTWYRLRIMRPDSIHSDFGTL